MAMVSLQCLFMHIHTRIDVAYSFISHNAARWFTAASLIFVLESQVHDAVGWRDSALHVED